jgi:predicted dehydrogenase
VFDKDNLLKFAIIGSGYMANEHAKAIFDSPECKIVAIYSTNPFTSKELANLYGIANIEQSIYGLYHNNYPDILIISVSGSDKGRVSVTSGKISISNIY